MHSVALEKAFPGTTFRLDSGDWSKFIFLVAELNLYFSPAEVRYTHTALKKVSSKSVYITFYAINADTLYIAL